MRRSKTLYNTISHLKLRSVELKELKHLKISAGKRGTQIQYVQKYLGQRKID